MLPKIPGAAVQGAQEVARAPKAESFGRLLQTQKPAPAKAAAVQPAQKPQPTLHAQRVPLDTRVQSKPQATQLINEVSQAQAKLDQILKMAESGRTFTPAELLAFQAHAYRASQELDLASRVVDKATSGVKQTLQTQV